MKGSTYTTNYIIGYFVCLLSVANRKSVSAKHFPTIKPTMALLEFMFRESSLQAIASDFQQTQHQVEQTLFS